MTALKTSESRQSLLKKMRKQRLRYVSVLPSLITILNGLSGFASVVFAAKGSFAMAGYALLLAMIMDVLDGRVARMSQSTSSFGGQLDSLCDMISFGLAPAFILHRILAYRFENFAVLSPAIEGFLQRSVWLAAGAY